MYVDEFKQQLPDIDQGETSEWIDSLDQVVEDEGETRARFLLFKLLKRARQLQVGLPPLTNTRYINTISPEQEPFFPGDEELERRIRRLIRWNAVAMVLRANTSYPGIGGHLATYASAASLYEVGLQPLLPRQGRGRPRRPGLLPGPRRARDLRPGVPRGSDQRGPARPLPARDAAAGRTLSSYPHPRLMPDFWEFPTVSMGLGPVSAIYQARFNRYLENRGLLDTSKSRVWAFLGDGETDEPEALGALSRRRPRGPRQPDLRRQLQPPAPRRPGSRQRQDHPGARGGLPRLGLERDQGHLGPRVGRAPRPRRRRRPRREDEHDRRRRVPEVLGRRRRLHPRALLRPGSAPAAHGRAPDRRRPRQAAPRRPRLPQGLRGVQGRDRVPRRPDGRSSPRPSRAGRSARASRPGTSPTRRRSSPRAELRIFRDRLELPIPDEQLKDAPYYHPGPKSEEIQYLHRAAAGARRPAPETGRAVARRCRRRSRPSTPSSRPAARRRSRTTMAFTRLLRNLIRDPTSARGSCRSSPTRPGRSAWTRSSTRSGSTPRSGSATSRSTPSSS